MVERTSRVEHPRGQRKRRARWARVVIALLVIVLGYSLFDVQVSSAERYALIAKENRMRPVVLRSPRGTIYDRYGRVVAENTVGYRVLLMPAPIDSLRAQVAVLAPILQMDSADVERAFRRFRVSPNYPMIVNDDAPDRAVATLLERKHEFPSALIHEYPKRHYPAGAAIAHFIGYVNEINERQLGLPQYRGYQQGRWIGQAGLEAQYERWLGGEPGVRYLEVDAQGRIKRWLPEETGLPAVPGRDLQLHLDLDLQKYLAEIFPKEWMGAIVAIEPQTGGILAYYSNPSYDPNRFIGGVSADYWRELQEDPRIPLLDRVVASGQPAASTWKLAVAGIALDLGAIEPEEYMPIPCTGGLSWGGRYARCWLPSGHGRMDLINGIKNSCNVYFYQVAIRIGLDRFLEHGTRMGFDRRTGVDVPHEIKPNFPNDRDYWVERFGYRAQDPEILSLAIGQGPLTMTVLKLAHIYSTLTAPEGKVPAPRLAMNGDQILGTQQDTFQFRISPRDQWYIEAGLRRVLGPGGTAARSRLVEWEFIGKTGTAQAPSGADHAWFVGMGAREVGADPEIAVTMFLAHAEHGYTASGYVGEAINFYLDRKYNRPFELFGTPRLRAENGLPVNWEYWTLPVVDPPIPPAEP
ncbi:MAG: penicillin-binding protein 2 [Longimicrobiales bacterium]